MMAFSPEILSSWLRSSGVNLRSCSETILNEMQQGGPLKDPEKLRTLLFLVGAYSETLTNSSNILQADHAVLDQIIGFSIQSLATDVDVTHRPYLLQLLGKCYPLCRVQCVDMVWEFISKALLVYSSEVKVGIKHDSNDQAIDSALDIHTAVDLLSLILKTSNPHHKKWLHSISEYTLKLIVEADPDISGKLVGIVFTKILTHSIDEDKRSLLDRIWQLIEDIYDKQAEKSPSFLDTEAQFERPFLLMCGFADWFFPVGGDSLISLPLTIRKKFWLILQSGFSQYDSLSRKRALYILKRIIDITEQKNLEYPADGGNVSELPIFYWDKKKKTSFQSIWQDYILLIEALEEKQVHVIKPLMPRFVSLIGQTLPSAQSLPLLHTSWILTLLKRVTTHESAFIKRWGFMEFLKIDMHVFPLVDQSGPSFLHNEFVTLLAESNMYYKPPELLLGNCAPIGEAIAPFMTSIVSSLKTDTEKTSFLTSFIHRMLEYNWSGSALVYVSRAMALLEPTPVCCAEVVNDIRELLQLSMGSLEIFMRGTSQCYMSSAVLKIVNPSAVNPSELMPLFAILQGNESLARNSALWKEYVNWLKTVSISCPEWSKEKLTSLMQSQFSPQIKGNIEERKARLGNAEVLAAVRMGLLILDAGLYNVEPNARMQHPVDSMLGPVTATLSSVNTHVYMSSSKAKQAINIMVTFLQNADSKLVPKDDVLLERTKRLVNECIGEVVIYSCRQISEEAEDLHSIENITFFVKVLEALGLAGIAVFASSQIKDFVQELMETHWKFEKTDMPSMKIQLKRYAGMKFVGLVAKLGLRPGIVPCSTSEQLVKSWNDKKPVHDFTRPVSSKTVGCAVRGDGNSAWGRVSAEFISGQWYCVALHLSSCYCLTQEDYNQRLNWCMEALNVTSSRNIIPVIKAIKLILPKVKPLLVRDTLQFTWKKVMEESRNTLSFWSCWETFVDSIFQPGLLNHEDDCVRDCLNELIQNVFAAGEEKQGLVNTMMLKLCEIWRNDNLESVIHYIDALISGIVFGPNHDRSRKQYQETVAYLSTVGPALSTNQLKDDSNRDDNQVRAMAYSLLCHLKPDLLSHQALATKLLEKLPLKHKQINQARTYRDFINSLAHREKHRIVVALLIMERFIYKDNPDGMLEVLMDLLSSENHSSVRVMVEWLMIRLFLHHQHLFHRVLTAIQRSDEKRMAYLCSLFTIATHVVKSSEVGEQENLMLQLIPKLLPWCTMHHFNCRTFAQACIIMLWQTCVEQGLQTAIKTHSVIESLVHFQKTNINQSKGTQKLLDNFFFHFDPVADYSVETLLLTLPRLTCLQDDEWIHPKLLTQVDPSWHKTLPSLLPLENTRRVLDTCEAGTWKVKFVDPDTFEVTDGNVQKKIIPWISMLPEQDLEPELCDEFSVKRNRCGELILVTSLIDKVPNLGGLCRTSEIFGVAEFVIGNLKHIKVYQFESLSVTAHKWIPIKEVRPHMLKTYLLEMKNEGYTLVGAEQTADSVNLREYTFPRKTLLLLGNEKEGIPIDLIQLLDVCVEIPQQGVIRSLNVHVSGALLIWEYTRQWLSSLPS